MPGNPYVTRVAAQPDHGRTSERRVSKTLKARLHPASGALSGRKSDATMVEANFRLEMKSTVHASMTLEQGWLTKISKEALTQGQRPGVVLSFVTAEGKPVMNHHAEWVAIPLSVFRELLGERDD
jgi:hypothetical protein